MIKLFEPYRIKEVELRNRIVMSPMCMFRAAENGIATDFHKVHYSTRAVGKVGLIMVEATAVTPGGRISDSDLGIWSDEHITGLKEIVRLLHKFGSKAGIQLAHAGRKSRVPDIMLLAPSPLAFGELRKPKEMDNEDIQQVQNAFVDAAIRAEEAGFDVLEIHAAHGFLINEFLSPITNKRSDKYGGSLKQRMLFITEIIDAIKRRVKLPLLVRISATDWAEGGLDINDSIELSRELNNRGVSLIDVSSGGILPEVNIFEIKRPGYNVEFSEKIKSESGIPASVVGMINDPALAESILQEKKADLIFIGRELLRNPYFAVDAQIKLGVKEVDVDPVYKRAYDI